MRFSVFLALAVAAFVMFANAESAALSESERNLRSQQVGGLTGKADDFAATFLEKARKSALLKKADKFEEAGNLQAAKVWRSTAGAISRVNKGQRVQLAEMVRLAKTDPEKVSKMVADIAKKDPKKWSNLKKTIVGLLGVSVGGGIIYGTVQLSKTTAPATA